MKILAFDTSTQQCSVALYYQGAIKDVSLPASNQHAELILPLIESLLSEAGLSLVQLDAIGFGRGPGSFTGLRIAASLAQGLACTHDIPVAPISTLQALAQAAYEQWQAKQAAVAIDARMQQIYWSTFKLNTAGIMESVSPEMVVDPEQVSLNETDWTGIGTGWAAYPEQLQNLRMQLTHLDEHAVPQARTIAWLAQKVFEQNLTVAPEYALPIYLRDKVC